MTVMSKVGLATAGIVVLLTACATAGPTFMNVEEITVQQISPDGLKKFQITKKKDLKEAAGCLYTTATVTEEHSQSRNLLQTTFLIDVKDTSGIRSFELFTDQHLKGNKGNYYHNTCIYKIIQNHG